MTTSNERHAGGLSPAWLLHRRPFRNTSLIIDLFLPERGRVGALGGGYLRRFVDADGNDDRDDLSRPRRMAQPRGQDDDGDEEEVPAGGQGRLPRTGKGYGHA